MSHQSNAALLRASGVQFAVVNCSYDDFALWHDGITMLTDRLQPANRSFYDRPYPEAAALPDHAQRADDDGKGVP